MTAADAEKLLAALADGIDPVRGQRLPDQSPYHDPEVIRALFTAVRHLRAASAARSPADRAGQPWTPEEEAQLAREFESGGSIPRIAAAHRRTRGAISARLDRLEYLAPLEKPPGTRPSYKKPEAKGRSEVNSQRHRISGKWSPEEVDRLLRDYEAGRTFPDIASRLGRSIGSVEVKLFSLGKIGETPPQPR